MSSYFSGIANIREKLFVFLLSLRPPTCGTQISFDQYNSIPHLANSVLPDVERFHATPHSLAHSRSPDIDVKTIHLQMQTSPTGKLAIK